jgi:hypothetical protein
LGSPDGAEPLSQEDICPQIFSQKLLNHAKSTTSLSRKWMEENPGKRMPKDYSNFPGKMDHTTVFCYKVTAIEDTARQLTKISANGSCRCVLVC